MMQGKRICWETCYKQKRIADIYEDPRQPRGSFFWVDLPGLMIYPGSARILLYPVRSRDNPGISWEIKNSIPRDPVIIPGSSCEIDMMQVLPHLIR